MTLVVGFGDLGRSDAGLAGGKGASLGELHRAGVPVPAGCVVTTRAFELALGAIDPDGTIRRTVDRLTAGDAAEITRTATEIQRRMTTVDVPAAVRAAITRHYARLDAAGGAAAVAVRSSATGEDSAEYSFAGLQDTYLWVRGADPVCAAVRQCWASLYSVESLTYRRHHDLPERGLAMAVVIQRMVDPRCAGVMFTRSPVTGDRSVVAIEGCWGLGSALVGGDVTPDSFLVNKVTGEILARSVAGKQRRHRMDPSGVGVLTEDVPAELRDRPCLTDTEIRRLAETGRAVERHYGCPQDIEWAIARDGTDGAGVFLLQSRPETVWAKRDGAPAAAPRARAFDHVLDLLGGGTR